MGSNIFYGATIAPCVLIFKHKKSKSEKGNVLFIDATEMYQPGRAQNYLAEEHVDQILKIYQNREEKQHISKIIKLSKIAEEDWNLSVSRYIEPKSKEIIVPLEQASSDLKKAITVFEKSEGELKKILEKEKLL